MPQQALVVDPKDVEPAPSARTEFPSIVSGVSKQPLIVSPDDVEAVGTPKPTPSPTSKVDPRIKTMDPTKHDAKIGPAPSGFFRGSRVALPLAGMMVGGAKGAALGTMVEPGVGTFVGGLAGAGVGAFGGEGLEIALEGLSKKFGFGKGLTTPTVSGAASRLGEAANTGMVGEAMGQAGPVVASKIAAPFKDQLEPFAKEAMETFSRKGKPAISPGEISKSRALGFARNWSERSIFGGAGQQGARQSIAEERVLKVLDDLGPQSSPQKVGATVQAKLPESPAAGPERQVAELSKSRVTGQTSRAADQSAIQEAGTARTREIVGKLPSATPVEAGQSVRDARAVAIKRFRSQERVAWKAFEDQTGAIPIETPQLDAFVETLPARDRGQIMPDAGSTAAQRIAKLTGVEGQEVADESESHGKQIIVKGKSVFMESGASGKQFSTGVRTALKQLGQDAPEGDAPLTVRQFQRTVSDLGRLQRSLEQSAKFDPSKYNAQLGLVKQLNKLAHADLESVLTKASSVEQGGAVSPGSPLALYHEATTLTRLGNEQLFNEEVRRVVKQAPEKVTTSLLRPNNSTAVKMTTGAVGSEAMQPVRRVALEQILTPDPVTKQIPWKKVLGRISTLGDDTLTALFPNGEAAGVKRIADAIVEADRISTMQSRAELGALAEARASVKAAKQADPFAPFRKMSPEKLTSSLFQRDNVTAVNAIKTLVGDEGFKPIQRVAMERVLEPNVKTGAIDWAQVSGRLNHIDPDTLSAFYPGTHATEVKRVAGLMVKLAKPQSQGGQMGMMLGQYGVIVGALGGVLPAKAGVIVLTPKLLSVIFSSKIGLKWLSTGLEVPAGGQAAIRAAAQLTAFLYRESKNEREQKTQSSEKPGAANTVGEAFREKFKTSESRDPAKHPELLSESWVTGLPEGINPGAIKMLIEQPEIQEMLSEAGPIAGKAAKFSKVIKDELGANISPLRLKELLQRFGGTAQ